MPKKATRPLAPDATRLLVESDERDALEAPPVSTPIGAKLGPASSDVPVYRRCPKCWKASGGVGVCQGTKTYEYLGSTRHYRCRVCGAKWEATIVKQVSVAPDHVKAVT